MKHLLAWLGLLWCFGASAAETIPPAPLHYFNDFANVVPAATANRLNRTLEQFERDNSSQLWVAVYPKMESDSSIEDYTVRVARAWRVGQQAKNNGAILFVFVQDHKLYIQVGYGLEGPMPDALCKRIVEDEITPHFRSGDYAGGLTAGVTAMISAAKGEYRGTGRTVNDNRRLNGPFRTQNDSFPMPVIVFIILLIFVIAAIARSRGGRGGGGGWMIGSGGFGGFGGGFSSGGFGGGGFSGGGGGFSGGDSGGGGGFAAGGGGSFGGGGAGGSW